MIEVNGFNTNPLYIKKKIDVAEFKSTPNFQEDDELSLQSTPIEGIIEEKTCTLNESETSQGERRSKDFSQAAIDRIRFYGEIPNFRTIVKGLLKKRGEITVPQGRFKPEYYNRDFLYYFNSNKCIQMIKRVKPKLLNKSKIAKSFFNFSCGLQGNSYAEPSLDRISLFTGNPNASMNRKKCARANISKCLTKIPSKIVKVENKRLDLAYNKAKDAARVVRRLEYSYNMKMNMMYSKQVHKENAQIIQKWWKRCINARELSPYARRIQKVFRGILTRAAFRKTLVFIQYLPFLAVLHNKFKVKLNPIGFEEILFRHGIQAVNTLILPATNLILKRVKLFLASRVGIIRKIYHMRCSLKKFVFDKRTSTIFEKLQGSLRIFLMKNNEKIMLHYAGKVHPNIFYFLKYGSKGSKRKIVSFRRCYQKLQEFNLKVNKGIEGRFELLPFIMRKIYWKSFKEYNEEVKKRDNNRPVKKRLIRKTLCKNDKKNIRKAFLYWKRYNIVHYRFIKPHKESLLTMMVQILQTKKNISSTLFLNKIRRKAFNRPTKKEAMRTILTIKNDKTPKQRTYLNKYFQLWRNTVHKSNLTKSSRKVNRFFNNTRRKFRTNKAIKHFFANGLIKTASFFKGASLIQKKLKKNIYGLVYRQIRSIGFKEKTALLFKKLLHPGKEKFLQWAFENKKYNHAIKDYVKLLRRRNLCKNRKSKLISIYNHLKTRLLQHFLRRGFIRYRMDSGIYFRHTQSANVQLLFFNKPKRLISDKKYRLLRYTVNKITNGQEDFRINSKLIAKWDSWKKEIVPFKIKKILKRRVKKITAFKLLLKRRAVLTWKKKTKALQNLHKSSKFKNNQQSVKTNVVKNKRIKEEEEEEEE